MMIEARAGAHFSKVLILSPVEKMTDSKGRPLEIRGGFFAARTVDKELIIWDDGKLVIRYEAPFIVTEGSLKGLVALATHISGSPNTPSVCGYVANDEMIAVPPSHIRLAGVESPEIATKIATIRKRRHPGAV